METQVFTADWIFNGTGQPPIRNGIIVVERDEVVAIGEKDKMPFPQGPDVKQIDLGRVFVLPGLIDIHSHLVLPGDGGVIETWMKHSDSILLMQAAKNAHTALMTGVTTQADLGARNQVAFSLRKAIEMGLTLGPRLILCGRPLTRTLGHCWYFKGEADGPDEIRRAVRQLVGEGADIIKMMVTGGGTRGTDSSRLAYDFEELQAASSTAHLLGKKALAHCGSTEGIRMSLEAGFDVIVHAHFNEPGGSLNFQPELARRLANSPVYVNPTLNVNMTRVRKIQAKTEPLTAEEQKRLQKYDDWWFNEVVKMVEHGVRMVAGSDSGWVMNPFGDFVSELEAFVAAGLSAKDALLTATRDAAKALGCDNIVGTLEPGKKADFLVVLNDPTEKIGALREIQSIWLGGQQVVV